MGAGHLLLPLLGDRHLKKRVRGGGGLTNESSFQAGRSSFARALSRACGLAGEGGREGEERGGVVVGWGMGVTGEREWGPGKGVGRWKGWALALGVKLRVRKGRVSKWGYCVCAQRGATMVSGSDAQCLALVIQKCPGDARSLVYRGCLHQTYGLYIFGC